MRIRLVNFRCYTDSTFEFPDTGLVLLSGESGSGKSTILNGILFALFGSKAVRKPCGFGKTTCTVHLEMDGISITRTNKPNRLVVTTSQTSYEDDAAQEYIAKVLGVNCEGFLVSSYIGQKNGGSILSLPQTDQLVILKTLSSADANKYKVTLKSLIKEATENQIKAVAQVDLLSSETQRLANIKKVEDPDDPNVVDRIERYPQLLEDLLQKINIAKDHLQKVQKVMDLENKIEQLDHEMSGFPEITTDSNTLKSQLDLKKNYEMITQLAEKELSEFNKKRATNLEKRKQYPSLETLKHNLEYTKEHCSEWTKLYKLAATVGFPISSKTVGDGSFDKVRSAVKEYCTACLINSDPLDCPQCGVHLIIYNGKLTKQTELEITPIKPFKKLDNGVYTSVIEQLSDLANIENTFETVKKNLEELEYSIECVTQIEKDLAREYCPSASLTSMKLRLVDPEPRESVQDLESSYASTLKLESLQEKFEKATSLHSSLSDELASTKNVPDLEQIQREITILKKNHLDDKQIFEKMQRFNEYQSNVARLAEWQERLASSEKNARKCERTLAAYLTLEQKLKKAELLALESTISTINSATSMYIEEMFPDNSLTARLESTEKGITTTIIYKGSEYDSINQLSGGEFDRCTVASVCGINNIVGSKILIMDEALASLDSETNTDIFTFLKNLAKEKLILVCSHEAVRGIFDLVIDL